MSLVRVDHSTDHVGALTPGGDGQRWWLLRFTIPTPLRDPPIDEISEATKALRIVPAM